MVQPGLETSSVGRGTGLWSDAVQQNQDWSEENCFVDSSRGRRLSPFLNQRRGAHRHPLGGQQRRIQESPMALSQRLDNANTYFRRKAAEVLDDESALTFLHGLYQDVVIDLDNCGVSADGVALAKLTAANFCEVGANVISITISGRRFLESVKKP